MDYVPLHLFPVSVPISVSAPDGLLVIGELLTLEVPRIFSGAHPSS